MFFLAKDGAQYAVSRVISYRSDNAGQVRVIIDGVEDELAVDGDHWNRALTHTAQSYAAAAPGTYVLWLWRNDMGEIGGYNRTNIIGWSIGGDGYPHGWTVNGADHGEVDLPPVLHPDGRVEVCFDEVYDSVAEWYASAVAKSNARAGADSTP